MDAAGPVMRSLSPGKRSKWLRPRKQKEEVVRCPQFWRYLEDRTNRVCWQVGVGFRIVETAGLPIGLPSSLASSFSLIQSQASLASVCWLGASICI